jgi:hypothetical protein
VKEKNMAEMIVKANGVNSTKLPSGVEIINLRFKKKRTGKVFEWWGLFKCSCGKEFEANIYRVKNCRTKSCGCLANFLLQKRSEKHGHAKDNARSRVYVTWESMKQRCYDQNCRSYKSYGGRGIKVCDRWKDSFVTFFGDMGEKPLGATLERIDVNGDYSPCNCRWATAKEQSRNKQNTRWIEAFGQKKSLAEWCEERKLNYKAVQRRLIKGWSPERAVSQPLRGKAV